MTLMEVLVASLIIAICLAGLAGTFVLGKQLILHNRYRMSGGELGRVFLDPLQMEVDQSTWDTVANGLTTSAGSLYCDSDPAHAGSQHPNCPSVAERTINNTLYDAQYDIDDIADTDLRKVKVTIYWTEQDSG